MFCKHNLLNQSTILKLFINVYSTEACFALSLYFLCYGWMDGPPWRRMPAGAVMKTPATKAKDLFKVVLPTPVATTLSISRAVDNHLAAKYSK